MSKVKDLDIIKSEEYWRKYAPNYLEAMLLAGRFDTAEQIPETDEEFEEWLIDYYGAPSTHEERLRKKRLRRLWAVGAIFFFAAGRYYTRYRQPIAWVSVRGNLDSLLEASKRDVDADCAALRDGRISLGEWQSRMETWIKMSQIVAGALQVGGYDMMTAADWQRVENAIYFQLDHLRQFSNQIAGGLPLDGNICRRMKMYLDSARGTYHAMEEGVMANRGFDLYLNVLSDAEHCGGCIEETAKGWIPVGTGTPIGARDCMSGCKCHWEYMNSETGRIDARN
jgi:hypothetical protein